MLHFNHVAVYMSNKPSHWLCHHFSFLPTRMMMLLGDLTANSASYFNQLFLETFSHIFCTQLLWILFAVYPLIFATFKKANPFISQTFYKNNILSWRTLRGLEGSKGDFLNTLKTDAVHIFILSLATFFYAGYFASCFFLHSHFELQHEIVQCDILSVGFLNRDTVDICSLRGNPSLLAIIIIITQLLVIKYHTLKYLSLQNSRIHAHDIHVTNFSSSHHGHIPVLQRDIFHLVFSDGSGSALSDHIHNVQTFVSPAKALTHRPKHLKGGLSLLAFIAKHTTCCLISSSEISVFSEQSLPFTWYSRD